MLLLRCSSVAKIMKSAILAITENREIPHGRRHLRNILIFNDLQKAVFRLVKHGLLHAERWPFGR